MAQTDAEPDPSGTIDWADVFVRALAVAATMLSPTRAEETVSAGIEHILGGNAPWDPDGKQSIERHVIGVGYNLLRNQRRADRRRRREDFVAKLSTSLEEGAPLSPEDALEDRKQREALYDSLWKACAESPDAQALLLAERDGVQGCKDQTRHCNMSERAWTNARTFIGRRLPSILAAEAGDEEGAA
jgi:hypothetical protein